MMGVGLGVGMGVAVGVGANVGATVAAKDVNDVGKTGSACGVWTGAMPGVDISVATEVVVSAIVAPGSGVVANVGAAVSGASV